MCKPASYHTLPSIALSYQHQYSLRTGIPVIQRSRITGQHHCTASVPAVHPAPIGQHLAAKGTPGQGRNLHQTQTCGIVPEPELC